MEPIKFEDNVREKLQEREIVPSNDAWNKLNSKLGPSKKNRINKSIWFTIAASFIGIIIITSLLVNNKDNSNQISTELVNENSKTIDESIQDQEKTPSEKRINGLISNENLISDNKTQKNNDNTVKIENNKSLALRTKKQVANKNLKSDPDLKDVMDFEDKANDVLIDAKVDEVVAQVQTLQIENESVSMEEINALLLNAQKEIQKEKISIGKNKK